MRAVSTNVARFVACVFVCLFGTRVSHVETTVLCSKAQLTRVLNALILTEHRVLPRDAVYAVVARPSVRPSVCHKPVLCRNDWTNRDGFWHGNSFHLSHTVV